MIPYNELYVFDLVLGAFLHLMFWPIMYFIIGSLTPAEKARMDKMKTEEPERYKKNRRKWWGIYFLGVPSYLILYPLAEVVTHNLSNSFVFSLVGGFVVVVAVVIFAQIKESKLENQKNI